MNNLESLSQKELKKRKEVKEKEKLQHSQASITSLKEIEIGEVELKNCKCKPDASCGCHKKLKENYDSCIDKHEAHVEKLMESMNELADVDNEMKKRGRKINESFQNQIDGVTKLLEALNVMNKDEKSINGKNKILVKNLMDKLETIKNHSKDIDELCLKNEEEDI